MRVLYEDFKAVSILMSEMDTLHDLKTQITGRNGMLPNHFSHRLHRISRFRMKAG
jgi:hypothetical protein